MGLRVVNVIDAEIAKANKVMKRIDDDYVPGFIYNMSRDKVERYDTLEAKVKVLKSLKTKLRKAHLIQ